MDQLLWLGILGWDWTVSTLPLSLRITLPLALSLLLHAQRLVHPTGEMRRPEDIPRTYHPESSFVSYGVSQVHATPSWYTVSEDRYQTRPEVLCAAMSCDKTGPTSEMFIRE